MRYIRRTLVLVSALLLILPLGLRQGEAQRTAEDQVVDGAALAGAGTVIGHVNPDFDFWPIYSSTTIDNDASHGLSGAFWPGFLVDAFLFLYDVQEQGRAAMGISETQWPNEPHTAEASSSAFLLNNFAEGCRFFDDQLGIDGCQSTLEPIFRDPPGVIAHSSSRSDHLDGEGSARGTRFSVPGVFSAEEARSDSSATFEDGRNIVRSSFEARDLRIGTDLHISTLNARSAATAGEEASADSSLELVQATFAGEDVTIDDQGVHLTEDPVSSIVNDALGAQGIEVRLVRGDRELEDGGETARASSGGLVIGFSRERTAEDIPQEIRDAYDQLCLVAEDSPINQEIHNVRIEQDNPLYGAVPIVPLPQEVEVEQSVPPPVGCPFLNRSFDVSFVLGLAEASARAIDLPAFTDTLGDVVTDAPADVPRVPTTATERSSEPIPEAPAPSIPVGSGGEDEDEVVLAAGSDDTPVADGVELLYIVFMVAIGLAVAGRFVLKEVSSP